MARTVLKAQVLPAPAQERAGGLDWGHLRFFLALARSGSLSRAAKQLGVDRNTVARRVAALEAALGLALFERGPQGWTRTAGGDELADLAGRVEEDVLALARHADARDQALRGGVRLTTTPHLATHLLAPAVEALRARHPGLVLEILADARSFDLTRREADLAVRLGRPRDAGLLTRRLAVMEFGLYAAEGSPAARRGRADFARDPFVGFEEAEAGTPQERWLARHGPERSVVFRSNSTAALQVAARQGVGVALLPRFAADADGALRRLETPEPLVNELWLVVHRDLRRTPRVRAVIEWLDELLAKAGPALAGRGAGPRPAVDPPVGHGGA